MNKWIRRIFGLLFFLVIILLGVATYFSQVLMFPKPLLCKKEFYLFCSVQEIPLSAKPSSVSWKTQDDITLRGWWIPSLDPKSKKVIIFSHGRGGSHLAGLRYAKLFQEANYNFLVLDHRGVGKSDKAAYTFGVHEKEDLLSATRWVLQEKKMSWIGMLGTSVGASFVLLAMNENKSIQAAFLEGPPSDAKQLIIEGAQRQFKLSRFPIVEASLWIYQFRSEINIQEASAIKIVDQISPRPLFFAHGMQDKIITPQHTQMLFAKAKQPKELWLVKEAGHVDIWKHKTTEMKQKLIAFFDKHSKTK